jgi:hypothetical protein
MRSNLSLSMHWMAKSAATGANPDCLAILENRRRFISTSQRGSAAAPSADYRVVVMVRATMFA